MNIVTVTMTIANRKLDNKIIPLSLQFQAHLILIFIYLKSKLQHLIDCIVKSNISTVVFHFL